MKDAAAVSGVATVEGKFPGATVRFTVSPTSASGTGTVTVRTAGTTDYPAAYEAAYASDGTTALTVDLSAHVSMDLPGPLTGVKVTSDNSGDTFGLVVGPT